jgi:3-methyladenine DNA glycosylase AlkD
MGFENCGRKPLGWYRDLNDLLDRSFKEVMAAFDRDDISQLEKAKIGAGFLMKRVGEKIDLSIEHTINPAQIDDLAKKIIAIKSAQQNKIESIPE